MSELAHLRKTRGLTQVQLAELVGVKQHTLSEIECGKAVPSLEKAFRYSEALGVSLDKLAKLLLAKRLESAA